MADTLKEIYNNLVTISNVSPTGKTTLFTTDANTQYVIKDIDVSYGFTGTPKLIVNNIDVASLKSAVTGSCIVDASSTVEYKISDTYVVTYFKTPKYVLNSAVTGWYPIHDWYTTDGVYRNSTAGTLQAVTQLNGPILSLTKSTVNNNYYYINWNSGFTWDVYKRAGDISGAQTNIGGVSGGSLAFDNVNKIYTFSNSTSIGIYNIDTDSSSSIATSPLVSLASAVTNGGDSYCLNNGYIILRRTFTESAILYLLNPATGTYTVISGLTAVAVGSSNHKLSGYYNSTTGRYTFYRRNGATLYKTTLTNAVTIGTAYTTGFTETTYSVNTTPSTCYIENTDIYYSYNNNDTYLYTIDTITSIATSNSQFSPGVGVYGVYITKDTSIYTSLNPSSVKLRITGVKSTI